MPSVEMGEHISPSNDQVCDKEPDMPKKPFFGLQMPSSGLQTTSEPMELNAPVDVKQLEERKDKKKQSESSESEDKYKHEIESPVIASGKQYL